MMKGITDTLEEGNLWAQPLRSSGPRNKFWEKTKLSRQTPISWSRRISGKLIWHLALRPNFQSSRPAVPRAKSREVTTPRRAWTKWLSMASAPKFFMRPMVFDSMRSKTPNFRKPVFRSPTIGWSTTASPRRGGCSASRWSRCTTSETRSKSSSAARNREWSAVWSGRYRLTIYRLPATTTIRSGKRPRRSICRSMCISWQGSTTVVSNAKVWIPIGWLSIRSSQTRRTPCLISFSAERWRGFRSWNSCMSRTR